MSLDKAIREFKFDKRLIDQRLKNGEVSAEDYKKHLESLPDLANQCEKIDIDAQNDDNDIH